MDATTPIPDLLRACRLTYTVIGEGSGYSRDHVKHVAAGSVPVTPEFAAAVLAFLERRGEELAETARRLREQAPSAGAPPGP